ncbi:MAG: hypothetical protein ACOX0A_04650 [Thermoguttaceae bacterium]|jgi:flagellar biosynthesis/type III secretory pathway M-ring protein FliF/YscJ
MNNDGKKTGMIRAIVATVLLVSTALGVWAFCNFQRAQPDGTVYVFDGWNYGREDQKKASAALASAGLGDYVWERGKLLVPTAKKNEFQMILANAGAYPKAPSELRVEALREMSVFESDSKTRARELNACAQQLERTIEQMRGVEYATVGVCSRREQVGLVAKNIITASIGVAFANDYKLDANALSAITVASRHQLGIADVSNLSIIDLKEGKSYFGVENAVGVNSEVALVVEKERIEKYWRDKFLEAFSDIKNLRVSVVADVAYADEQDEQAVSAEDRDSPIAPASYLELAPKVEEPIFFPPQPLTYAPVQGRYETLGDLSKEVEEAQGAVVDNEPSPPKKGGAELAAKGGFAQLGSPKKAQTRSSRKTMETPVALSKKSSTFEKNMHALDSKFYWTDSSARSCISLPIFALFEHEKNEDVIKSVSCFEKSLKDGVDESFFQAAVCFPEADASKGSSVIFTPLAAVQQTEALVPFVDAKNDAAAEPYSKLTTLRSITVRIAVPRSYLRSLAQNHSDAGVRETFADDSEEQVLSEIKSYAIDLFRPTSERLGWNEADLDRRFIVASFSDADVSDFPVEVESQNIGSNHSSSYATSREDWSPLPAGDDLAANLLTESVPLEHRVVVSEPSGKVAEISQTVASDVETLANDTEQDANNLRNSIALFWERVKLGAQTLFQNSLARNVVFATVAAFLFMLCFIAAMRYSRNRRKEARIERAKESREKRSVVKDVVEKKRRSSDSDSKRPRLDEYYDTLDDLEDYNDTLEGSLHEIAAARGVAFSRQSENLASESSRDVPSDEYWRKRREALDLIAQFPERAVSSLQEWVKNT